MTCLKLEESTDSKKSLGIIPFNHPANQIDEVDTEIKDMIINKQQRRRLSTNHNYKEWE